MMPAEQPCCSMHRSTMNHDNLVATMVALFTNTLTAVRSGASRAVRVTYTYGLTPLGKAGYRFVKGSARTAAVLAALLVVAAVVVAGLIRALDSDSVEAEIEHGHVDDDGLIVAEEDESALAG